MFTETTSGILDLIPFSIIKETNLDLFISQHGVLEQRGPFLGPLIHFFFSLVGQIAVRLAPQSPREKYHHISL